MDPNNTQENNNGNESLPGANEQNTQSKSQNTSIKKSSNEDYDFEKELSDLRKENAKYRNRAKDSEKEAEEFKQLAEKAFRKLDDLEKTVTEKLTEADKKISEAEKKISAADKRAITSRLELEAKNAGVVSLEVFSKVVDASSLSISDNGEVLGVSEVIENLKKAHPFLFDSRSVKNTSSTLRIPSPATDTKKDLTALRKEDPRKYAQEKNALIRKYK